MKICAVICEYNPFHNGHKYQLEEIRRRSGCEAILCLMSGNFTQRGDAAVFDKFTRARHAVENGADAVLELPAAFSVSPAEIFARGAVHILSSIPAVTALAFGCESGSKEEFMQFAQDTLVEDKAFQARLKENMKDGSSYIRARMKTLLEQNASFNEAFLSSPNNILGTEYCRALLAENSKIEPLPILRIGGGYADRSLKREFSSASALRTAMDNDLKKTRKLIKKNLPGSVFADLDRFQKTPYPTAVMCALLSSRPEKVMKTPDCSEGLENRLLAMAKSNPDYCQMLQKVVSKRYTLSRLKRILAQNFLELEQKQVKSYLSAPLYYKTLCLKKSLQAEILGELSKGSFPLVVRKSDSSALKGNALSCFETDLRAHELYCALAGEYSNPHETIFLS